MSGHQPPDYGWLIPPDEPTPEETLEVSQTLPAETPRDHPSLHGRTLHNKVVH